MKQLMEHLDSEKFHISAKYVDTLFSHATKGGGVTGTISTQTKLERNKAFSSAFNFFLYAVILGIRHNKQVAFLEKEKTEYHFQPIKESAPRHTLIPYILMILLTQSDKGLIEVEQMNEEDLEIFAKDLARKMEAYANAGFGIITDYKAKNKDYFVNIDNFVNFLNDSKDS